MKKVFTFLLSLLITNYVLCQIENNQRPTYLLDLESFEYPLLSQAIFNGIYQYKGKIDYQIAVAGITKDIDCTITFNDLQSIQTVKYYLSEMSLQALNGIDNSGNMDANTLNRISLIKSITAKLDYAIEHPQKKSIHLIGSIVKNENNYFITTDELEAFQLIGDKTQSLKNYIGNDVVITGIVNEDKSIELIDFTAQKQNTLELCIMSHCPYGQQAVLNVLNQIENIKAEDKPQLDIRYIFYATLDGYKSMHGEEEIIEELVEITIRNNYKEYFYDYLKERFKNANDTWQNIASTIGMKNKEIEAIEQTIIDSRDEIIEQEYDYVANKNQILDGSPTFLWESKQIKNIRKISGFENYGNNEGRCSN